MFHNAVFIVSLPTMKQQKRYRIELRCNFPEWWRYNVEMMGAAFDEEAQRIGFVTASSRIAEVGSNLPQRPEGVEVPTTLSLTTPPCHHARLFLYIIPHTLPAGNQIDESRPFEVTITHYVDGQKSHVESCTINQWSGASLCLDLKA